MERNDRQNSLVLNSPSNSLTKSDGSKLQRAYDDRMSLSEALEAVSRMIAGYVNGSPSKAYLGAIASILCKYSRMVATKCADPTSGVAIKCRFHPTPADVVAWCETEVDSMRHMVDWHRRTAQQLRERDDIEARPTPSADVIERVRREMAAAGMPIMGDAKTAHGETPETVKARFGLSDEQWDKLPDAPRNDGYWQGVRVPAPQQSEAAE